MRNWNEVIELLLLDQNALHASYRCNRCNKSGENIILLKRDHKKRHLIVR